MDLVLLGGAHGRQAVDLVEEDDGGLAAPRLLEQEPAVEMGTRGFRCEAVVPFHCGVDAMQRDVPQLPLRLADPLAQAVRALAHEEGDVPPRLHKQACIERMRWA